MARIVIDDSNPDWGDRPYAKQPGGCGIESDYVHFTPNFFLEDAILEEFGPRGMSEYLS